MIKKLLLTLAVIAVVVLLARYKQQRQRRLPAEKNAESSQNSLAKVLATVAVVLMFAGTLTWGYMTWQERHVVVKVEVINTDSGKVTAYEAYKYSIEKRQFLTPEGIEVSLAANERMETKIKR